MSAAADGGPAFPITEFDQSTGHVYAAHMGVTVRDHFAGQALPCAYNFVKGEFIKDGEPFHHEADDGVPDSTLKVIANYAYLMADAMLEARAATPPATAITELLAGLREAQQTINSMKVEAETGAQGDEKMMLDAAEAISNEGLQADTAIRALLTKITGVDQ